MLLPGGEPHTETDLFPRNRSKNQDLIQPELTIHPVSGSRRTEKTRRISGSRDEVGTGGGLRQGRVRYPDRGRVRKIVLGGGSRGFVCYQTVDELVSLPMSLFIQVKTDYSFPSVCTV